MALPVNMSKVWVRGRIIELDGDAAKGAVVFTPSTTVLVNVDGQVVIVGVPFSVQLDSTGRFSVQLPCTDDPDATPTGWTYTVTEPGTGRKYPLAVPISTPVLNSPGDVLHGQPVIELHLITPAGASNGGTVQVVMPAVPDVRGPRYPERLPLRRWRTDAPARATRPVDVVVIGDSGVEGQGASTLAGRWVAQLGRGLQRRLPVAGVPGGQGLVPASFLITVPTDRGWAYTGNQGVTGAYGLANKTLSLGGPTGAMERTVFGTSVEAWYTRYDGAGSFDILVDGVVAATVDCAQGSPGLVDDGRRRVSLGGRGSHVVKLRYASGPNSFIGGLAVFDGDENAGVRIVEAGISGAAASGWAAGLQPGLGANLAKIAPSLIVIHLLGNDIAQGATPAAYTASMSGRIAEFRAAVVAAGAPAPSVLMVAMFAWPTIPTSRDPFVAGLRELVRADPELGLLDAQPFFPASATPGNPLLFDGLHLNDLGHELYAGMLVDALTDGIV